MGSEGGAQRSAPASPLRLIREAFHNPQDISCSVSSTTHVVLRRHDEDRDLLGRSDLVELSGWINAQLGLASLIGIGGVVRRESEIAMSYAEARTAIRVGSSTGQASPYDISDLRVEQLVTALPGRLRARVSSEIIGSLRSRGDWPATRATVQAWVESGFVLVDAAGALNVHRNTLVYRLRRIAAETGWQTSDRRRWLALYLACVSDGLPA